MEIFFSFMNKGGPIMWVILLFFILGFAVALDRLLYLVFTHYPFRLYEKSLLDRLNDEGFSSESSPQMIAPTSSGDMLNRFFPWKNYRYRHSPYYIITNTFFSHAFSPADARRSALERVGREEIEKMEKRVNFLALLGTVTPLLGLLGTVTGMINAFESISAAGGQPEVSVLAAGIKEAMLTTAFGLSVAIPSHLIYNFFEKKNASRIHFMNTIIHHLEENFHMQNSSVDEETVYSEKPGNVLHV